MQQILLILAALPLLNSEYIPPGPAYPCPKETKSQLLHPCVCEKGTDEGIYVRCENTGLAVLSVGLGNIAELELPIERLELRECKISHLYGPLLHKSTVRRLYIIDTPIKSIDQYAFVGVNRTLQELYFENTRINEFPKEAFKILGNLSVLSIDGHRMSQLGKDIFAGSEAAGRLVRVHLANGWIGDVAAEAFQNLKKLKILDLHGNRLASLKKNQFKGLRDTEVLDLSHNNISRLDGSHIGDLTKLVWCNVSHNQIGDIPRGMFARNTVLKVVHLDNNNIKKLDTNSFRGMRFLRRLYLQDNQISDVGRGTFAAVTRIGTVDLARNLIKKVYYQMFQQVKYAEIINLAENEITIIESQAFTDLYLANVNISHNRLETIETGAFQNCNNLTVLDLSYNNLSEISKKAFDENSYAGELMVAYNKFVDFSQIPIQNMTGIRVLNASHNFIEKIQRNAFPKLYELHTVDISHNNLTEIFNSVFQNLFSLRYVNLSYNAMEILKPSTFGTLPTILDLDLSHNKLSNVARSSLAKLASCRVLNLSHNNMQTWFQIPISLGALDMSFNNITSIPPNTWPSMNALLRLNLSHNMLGDNLASDSFVPLLTLQSLDLSDNGVSRPPWEALSSLTSLQYLYLQNNNLTSLSKSAFGNLPTLFHLDLSYNQIGDVARQSFQGLQQLLYLSLSGNGLDSIANEALKTLVALRKLDISHNNLERIDNKTHGLLDDCLSIESVDLSHNKISFLTKKMFPSNPWIPYRLREVDLSHNHIPVLTLDATTGAKTIRKLNFTGNTINDIRSYVLGNFTSLEVLDLTDNELTDMVSATSLETKLDFPENLTELYIANNQLRSLPLDNIKRATLRVLDVRGNELTGLPGDVVRKIRSGLVVYFEGNNLNCDCKIRPLKHYFNSLPPSTLKREAKYQNITCAQPMNLDNTLLLEVDEERLLCSGNTEEEDAGNTDKGNTGNTGDMFDFVSEPDLTFRDVQYAKPAINLHWFVSSTADIADFFIFIRDKNNTIHYSTEISYHFRSTTIDIDSQLKMALQNGGNFDICIQAKSSNRLARNWFSSQCQAMTKYSSWPKKLSFDKRRLTKRKYSWFGNNVLRLVSDSILITLCIFLGVCFRRLYDFEC